MCLWLAFPAVFAAGDKLGALDRKFDKDVRAAVEALDGIAGVAVKDLITGKVFLINGEEVFPQASSIKIALLYEVFKRAEEGLLSLEEFSSLEESRKVAGSGILCYLGFPRISLSLRDLSVLMIVLSDNTATNLLIERVGMESVNARMESLGLKQTRLRRKMMDLKAAEEGRENISTPSEMMRLLEGIWRGKTIKDPQRNEVLKILSIPKDSPLRDGVPDDIAVAEKPGELEGVRCDSGIVELPGRPYILCVMTTYLKNDSLGNTAIAGISKIAYEHFRRLARSSEYGRVISEK
jgi:beta-lactamase class A